MGRTQKKKVKYYSAATAEPSDKFIDTKKQKNRKKLLKKKSVFVLIVLLLLVALSAVICFEDMDVASWLQSSFWSGTSGEGYPVDITGTNVSYQNFFLVGKYPVYVSDLAMVQLNGRGNATNTSQHSYQNPAVVSQGNYFLLYDLGGKNYRLCNKKDTVKEGVAENQIFCTAVSKNGNYAAALIDSGYASQMRIYSVKGTELFSWHSPGYRIHSLAMDYSGEKIAAAGLTGENGDIKTTLYLFDITKEEPAGVYDFGDSIILSMQYVNHKIIAIGDRSVFIVDEKSGKLSAYPYKGQQLVSYDMTEKNIALILSPQENGNDGSLVLLDETLNENIRVSLTETGKSVAIGEGAVFILQGNQLNYLDTAGNELKTIAVEADISKICCYQKNIYGLGLQKIYRYQME